MLHIIYFIKTEKTKQNGEAPIYAKISYHRQSLTMSVRQSISEERWNATSKLRGPLKIEKEKVIKSSLDALSLSFERLVSQCVKEGGEVTLLAIKNKILGKPEKSNQELQLLDVFDLHNNAFEKKVFSGERSAASLQKYKRSKELIKNFLLSKYKLQNISLDDINGLFIYKLEQYLKYESIYKDKVGIKNNSVVKYFRNFKTVCNFGIKLEEISKNPFLKYDGKIQTKDAIYLTQSELLLIESKMFGIDRLDRVKDIFLFSCYTGYAPVDAQNLSSKNLISNNTGDLWIVTDRAKTGIRANVPVLPVTKKIISKYSYLEDRLIPKISNQKMNAYLKEIADICGINKPLTWYVARHTFATTITLGNGVKLENVSAMMGHSNIKQTQHYAKVLDVNIQNDMKKVMDIYK